MRDIDPLKEEEDEEDELFFLNQDKDEQKNTKVREIGKFILHEEFNENNPDYHPTADEKEMRANLSEIGKVWAMDHDFYCI